ncbi:MAG: glycerophosphodiester phosphodiesterase [Acidimicrobiia bacterium]|nr:glycerophosphodiester phosphodiesterase [Acidimicrobiia bacterium]
MASTPQIIAHRGASADAPENTLAAFEVAADQGADWVELDARVTRDGAVVVHHDPHLADGRIIAEAARAELPADVCLLAEALETCAARRLGVNVEIKCLPGEPDVDRVGEVTDGVLTLLSGPKKLVAVAGTELLVTSFWPQTLDVVRARAPELRTGQLLLELGEGPLSVEGMVAAGHVAVNPWDASVTAEMVDAAHAGGLAVNVWTVDDPQRLRQLAAMGVDGLITNTPAAARAALVDGADES